MAAQHPTGNALHANFDVDYVISFRFTDAGTFFFLKTIKMNSIEQTLIMHQGSSKLKQTSENLLEH